MFAKCSRSDSLRFMNETLPIDFADRKDVRAKLPKARRFLEAKRLTMLDARKEWEDWARVVNTLEHFAGVSEQPAASDEAEEAAPNLPADNDHLGPSDSAAPLDLVVEVVDRDIRKIRAQDVWGVLSAEGHELPKVAVSNALFYAAKRAKPPRLKQAEGRGYYAPLSFVEPPTTDDEVAPDQLHVAAATGEQRVSPEGGGT